MGLYSFIGNKKSNGFVNAIYARRNGGNDDDKILYKYYRTPERVNALIKSGSTMVGLGIYLEGNERAKDSPLYNEEVSMLPLYLCDGEEDDFVSFADDSFFLVKRSSGRLDDRSSEIIYNFESAEDFYEAAKNSDFVDYVYLYDSDTRQWYKGLDKKNLREAIIEEFDENSKDNDYTEEEIKAGKERLINYMDEIDQFIQDREKNKPVFIDSSTGEVANVQDYILYKKYYDLVMYARSTGLKIDGCPISKEMNDSFPGIQK